MKILASQELSDTIRKASVKIENSCGVLYEAQTARTNYYSFDGEVWYDEGDDLTDEESRDEIRLSPAIGGGE